MAAESVPHQALAACDVFDVREPVLVRMASRPRGTALAGVDGQTVDAFALGAALAQPFVDVVLSGAVSREQLAQNLAARPPASVPGGVVERPEAYWATRSALPWG